MSFGEVVRHFRTHKPSLINCGGVIQKQPRLTKAMVSQYVSKDTWL